MGGGINCRETQSYTQDCHLKIIKKNRVVESNSVQGDYKRRAGA
jgi:hypothetical protein